MISLYVDSGYFSPYALSAFAAATEKAIAEYVDECFDGPRLYPEDRQGRARARI
jgi:hypothetical protein